MKKIAYIAYEMNKRHGIVGFVTYENTGYFERLIHLYQIHIVYNKIDKT